MLFCVPRQSQCTIDDYNNTSNLDEIEQSENDYVDDMELYEENSISIKNSNMTGNSQESYETE